MVGESIRGKFFKEKDTILFSRMFQVQEISFRDIEWVRIGDKPIYTISEMGLQ